MNIKIINLGCPKNLVDSESMAGLLVDAGYNIVEDYQEANLVIINTCAFIESAKREAIEVIFDSLCLKEDIGFKVIVAGCLPQRYYDELLKEIPEVDMFIGVHEYPNIVEYVDKLLKEGEEKIVIDIDKDHSKNNLLVNYNRYSLIAPHISYIKIAEGCNNYCSYCVIPMIRGPKRSKKEELILDEVKSFVDKGTKEFVIIAQDTAAYGEDLYGEKKLTDLVDKISKIVPEDLWIRIMYVHPKNLERNLLELMMDRKNIVKYIDLPIQHISDNILKKMNRGITSKEIRDKLDMIRTDFKEIAIRTSLMVGFPGETNAIFEELKDFVREYKFERMGAFMFSREEGTPAYKFRYQVKEEVKEERMSELMLIQQEISEEANKKFIGKKMKVLVDNIIEENGENYFDARTEYDAYEIDQSVLIKDTYGEKIKIGNFVNVEILDSWEFDLLGKLSENN